MAKTRLDYDKDQPKHYVRVNGWLPAALDQLNLTEQCNRRLQYFTFCAANAIDVFLFLNNGLLRRDPETGIIENTYFCEKKPVEFSRITQLIGGSEPGFLGDFTDMILFEDDALTSGLDYLDEAIRHPRPVRQRLAVKRAHERFRKLGPIDILNLDICGTFFPPDVGMQSPMLRAVDRLLQWQARSAQTDQTFRSFTVFFTTHVESGLVNDDAMAVMIDVLNDNQNRYPSFEDRFCRRFGTTDVAQIASARLLDFYSVALPKTIVSVGFDNGWIAKPKFSGFYRRTREENGTPASTYEMFCWVVRFEWYNPGASSRTVSEVRRTARYEELVGDLTRIPVDVDRLTSVDSSSIRKDLELIVASRDDYLDRLTSSGY